MGLINVRDLLQFPGGDNTTDTVINGVHFNRTALEYWNYTLYSNNTLSNNSKCYLVFDQYRPVFLSNGSFINATTCYMPIYGLRERGWAGVVFAAIWAATVMFTLLNLKKHGQQFLREDKRFRLVGRRWQWYWMCWVGACGIISCVTSVDVDRDYLQDIAIVLQSFFYYLMLPGAVACVWEAVRHWGSWQERQIYDRDPFSLPQDDKRGQTEFWIPLVFYLFTWLYFFMIIPRSWTAIKKQHSPAQQAAIAKPSATDMRHKAAGILAVCAWLVICFSLYHSLKHYKPRASGFLRKISSFCHHTPTKLLLAIVVLAIRLAYEIASAWEWEISILKFDGNPAWPYGLGYAPCLLILLIFNVAGFVDENEDKILIRQRGARGRDVDREIGIVHKPAWWSKMSSKHLSPEDRLKALASELPGGGRRGGNTEQDPRIEGHPPVQADVELAAIPPQSSVRNRSRSRPREDPFRDTSSTNSEESRRRLSRLESDNASTATGATGLTGRTLASAGYGGVGEPVRIRSMLDV